MQFELTKELIENLRDIIHSNDEVAAVKLMEELHAADIAEIYDELNIDEAKFLYLLLDKEKAADVLAELEDDDRDRFLEALPSDVIAKQFIEEMDSDDAADILGDMPEEKKQEVLSHIDDIEQAGDIVDLLNYDEDTAGGLMAKEYIADQGRLDKFLILFLFLLLPVFSLPPLLLLIHLVLKRLSRLENNILCSKLLTLETEPQSLVFQDE